MAPKSLLSFCLLCILSGNDYSACAARLGEQQHSELTVRQILFSHFLPGTLGMLVELGSVFWPFLPIVHVHVCNEFNAHVIWQQQGRFMWVVRMLSPRCLEIPFGTFVRPLTWLVDCVQTSPCSCFVFILVCIYGIPRLNLRWALR